MGTKLSSIGAVGIAAESTVGTYTAITTANAIMEDVKATIEHEMQARNSIRSVAAPRVPLPGRAKFGFGGKLEMRGSGTAGTEPTVIGPVLKASGFSVATVASLVNRYTLIDNPSAGCGSISGKAWRDGIYAHGRGIMGNSVINLKAGQLGQLAFDGQGALYAEGESATPTAPADTPVPPYLENGGCYLLEVNQTTKFVTDDGVVEELRDGAASNVKFSITYTGTGNKIKAVAFKVKKNGTPADETNGLTLEMQGDSTGDPDGSEITNGLATAIATTQVGTADEWLIFWFATPPTGVLATVYHFVVEGDYTASADANVEFCTDVCAEGAQTSQYFDEAWADVALKNFSCLVLEAAEPTLYLADIEINPGAKVGLRNNVGSDEGIFSANITGFEPIIKIEPLEVTDAERDFYAYLTAATELFFYAELGTVAGNKFRFICLSCKRRNNPDFGDVEGELSHPLELQVETPSKLYIEAR
jgi:hypothetical protein